MLLMISELYLSATLIIHHLMEISVQSLQLDRLAHTVSMTCISASVVACSSDSSKYSFVPATADGPDASIVTTSSQTKSSTGSLQILLGGKRSTSQDSNVRLGTTLCWLSEFHSTLYLQQLYSHTKWYSFSLYSVCSSIDFSIRVTKYVITSVAKKN